MTVAELVERTLVERDDDHSWISELPLAVARQLYPPWKGYRCTVVQGIPHALGFQVVAREVTGDA